jgi:high affinity sulfate transporter 1
VVPTLRRYQRAWLAADLVAGLTLVAIAVPEQMATARLGNMPTATGLYAFIAGAVVFALIGSNAHMSVGGDSTITPIFAAGVAVIAAPGSPDYTHLVVAVALAAGVLLVVGGLLRLGWLADFLPLPVVTGVLAGIAIQIFVRQLPAVFGVPGGGTTTIGRLKVLFDQRDDFNGWTVAIALAVLAILVVTERINRRIPGALIALIGSTAAVAAFGLEQHGVPVIGHIHAGVPHVGLPNVGLKDLRKLTATVLTVAFLCVVQIAATARSGRTDDEPADELNRDLVAVGAGSVASGLVGSFAVNASPPRTAIVEESGGRTQATSLVAAVGVVVVLAVAGLLKDLPDATLGAILIFVSTRLFKVDELRAIFRFDRFEFALAVITIAVVGFVGIEQGVVVAILLALVLRTRLTARPRGAVLGREPGTVHWIPVDIGRPTESVPGVLVYLLYAGLWYGNVRFVLGRLRAELDAIDHPRALIFDADGTSDIDYTAARQVEQFIDSLKKRGIAFGVARASHLVHHDLTHSGLLQRLGPDSLFPSVQDAVQALGGENVSDPGGQ